MNFALNPLRIAILLASLSPLAAQAVIAPIIADTNIAAANAGTLTTITIDAANTGLMNFDLSTLPDGISAGDIAKATLVFYVKTVPVGGQLQASPITALWTETGVDSGNAPVFPFGSLSATSATIDINSGNRYYGLDVTAMVADWVDFPENNHGLALEADGSSPVSLTLDSKEAIQTSHPAYIEIVLKGPAGAYGADGLDGVDGADGEMGPAGPMGPVGAKGDIGLTGAQGPTGPSGAMGPMGLTGPMGPTGLMGLMGPAGAKGDTGLTGGQGPAGANGINGQDGAPGPVGPAGPQGLPGAAGSFPVGTAAGDIQYWNGAQWTMLPKPSINGKTLHFCNGIPSWSACTTYTIGSTGPSGGKFYYVDATGEHGLEAFLTDDTGATWAIAITSASNHGTGWHLPTKTELELLFEQKAAVANVTGTNYWSSTAASTLNAWAQNINNGASASGTQGNFVKTSSFAVRAVKVF